MIMKWEELSIKLERNKEIPKTRKKERKEKERTKKKMAIFPNWYYLLGTV